MSCGAQNICCASFEWIEKFVFTNNVIDYEYKSDVTF